MNSLNVVIYTILNAAFALAFGFYSKDIFEKQDNNRDPEVTASFFSIVHYVKSSHVESYCKIFACFVALCVFIILEFISLSPDLSKQANSHVVNHIVEFATDENAKLIRELNSKIPAFILPFVSVIVGCFLFYPAIRTILSSFRNLIQKTIDFKGNAQRLVDDVFHNIRNKKSTNGTFDYNYLETELERHFKRTSPRPRELTSDNIRLAKYQILYYSTFMASELGLAEALRRVAGVFGVDYNNESRIELINIYKIFIAMAIYVIFAYLYVKHIPYHRSNLETIFGTGFIWPEPGNTALAVQMLKFSLQVSLPFICGLAFYSLSVRLQQNSQERSKLCIRIAGTQLWVALFFGFVMHGFYVWRRGAGATQGVVLEFFDLNLLAVALIPSALPSLLLGVWHLCFNGGVIMRALTGAAIPFIGAILLAFLQYTNELGKPDGLFTYMHDGLIGFYILTLCMVIWAVLAKLPQQIIAQNPVPV